MDDVPAGAPVDAVAESIDGATGDWSVSGDAMRWSPVLAERGPETVGPGPGPLAGLDAAAGLGSALGLESSGMRRIVNGALNTLALAAGDVVTEFRQLTRGGAADPDSDR